MSAARWWRGLFATLCYLVGATRLGERFDPVLARARPVGLVTDQPQDECKAEKPPPKGASGSPKRG